MSKSTILAIFMIVLVLGKVTKETQGQEMCRDILMKAKNCDEGTCDTLCKQKWKGNGSCFPNVYTYRKSCLCTFPCKT
ncbi:low-molecular-weight cysteine-rich 52 [Arabidopsis thaliana]|uniref:Putative defensin-like protein 118 n=1 Tax=Arabidopsis thaliana TaxID=3702 RepID=DF118_ARATH|nr:low-molecular-weight cysteine-rich 52 [Arabidopsis thaliana]P82766.1 RecName: Full=Putative defensin-like protein 118; AltName: Full=Putative low-molecular-weight cysteine-rich protein 52; Short=Protein LCR52; Flags: Precursor [Arabidopsis thaliana]AEE80166.1 low-molecular-weight cysteine-rich 52 [Arabidopsis thaliana]|eukprot:NP_001030910.1 low-molecular-weight cysteine-rich 52 [Arabidopsis thaliana]